MDATRTETNFPILITKSWRSHRRGEFVQKGRLTAGKTSVGTHRPITPAGVEGWRGGGGGWRGRRRELVRVAHSFK